MSSSILAHSPECVNPSPHLKPAIRELYRCLCNLSRKKGFAWITNERLALEYGVSIPTAERWMKRLRSLSLIRTQIEPRNKRHRRKIFCLVPLASLRPGGKVESAPIENEGDCPSKMQVLSCAPDNSSNLPEKAPQHVAPPETLVKTAADVVASVFVSPSSVVTAVSSDVVAVQAPSATATDVFAELVEFRRGSTDNVAALGSPLRAATDVLTVSAAPPLMAAAEAVTAVPHREGGEVTAPLTSLLPSRKPASNLQENVTGSSPVVEQLVAQGMDLYVARHLAATDAEECLRQLQALPTYKCRENLPGLLYRAITGRYRRHKPIPAAQRHHAPQRPALPSPEALVESDKTARSMFAQARATVKNASGKWREYA